MGSRGIPPLRLVVAPDGAPGGLIPSPTAVPGAIRRTLHADGDYDVTVLARCPRAGSWVTVSRCAVCGPCEGVSADDTGAVAVLCRAAAARGQPMDCVSHVPRILDAMTRDVLCVTPGVMLDTLAPLLLAQGVGGAPVVGAAGGVLGMVTRTDLLRAAVSPLGLPGRCVGDVMTHHAFMLTDDLPLTRAAALMAYEGVHRIVVVEAAGGVVGVVSTSDVARWMARDG